MTKLLYSWTINNCQYNRAFIIGGYEDTLAHINRMITEAKKDFPNISDSDITVSKIYHSNRYKYMSVISFLISNSTYKNYRHCGENIEFSY